MIGKIIKFGLILDGFWMDFGWILEYFWHHFSTSISDRFPRGIQERFWEDLGLQFGGPEGVEKWTFAVPWSTCWLLGRSSGQTGSKRPPRSLQEVSWNRFSRILGPTWWILAPILVDFGWILHPIFVYFCFLTNQST